jgi:hypothetical protein
VKNGGFPDMATDVSVVRSFSVHQAASIPASLKRRRLVWDVAPNGYEQSNKSLAEKIPDISFSQGTNLVGFVTRQFLE